MSRRSLWIATRKGLFRARRGDGGWRVEHPPAFLAQPVSMVLQDPRDGAVYAALELGHFGVKLHRSDDDGASWTEVAAPSFAFDVSEGADDEALAKAPKLEMIWALEPGGADEAGRLWCGTIPGALFRSDDRGETWEIARALWDVPGRESWFGGGFDASGLHSVSVDPRDPKRLTVAISCAGVWKSKDSGASWEVRTNGMYAEYMPPEQREQPDVQDPHRLVACPADPDTWWVQHHNGIFVTNDAGRSWRDRPAARPSSFGFAVAVHPDDPKTAWFVPAVKDEVRVPVDGWFVVTRTRDGGESFEVLSDGLPDGPAYDLVFRHALDVAADGRTLACGSTTGDLWISEDGGERWRALSEHLPPVYAVRFAG